MKYGEFMNNLCILILLFFSYSFIGWIIEVCVGIIERQKIINRGFLIGPIVPIYGFGCIAIMLTMHSYMKDPIVVFLISIIICSVLEYFTSYIMEKIFKNRWWDYSNKKFNINGRVCLECAIPFGFGALIMLYGVNPILYNLYSKINTEVLVIITSFILLIFISDFILSCNIIITLKNISNSILCDSTELITKKVREILSTQGYLHRRLLGSFPTLKLSNTLSSLKERIGHDKKRLKLEKNLKKNN